MRTSKRLGQHFLQGTELLRNIAAASGVAAGEVVLEIGPGLGGLTAALLRRGAVVVAIEKDQRLGAKLMERFGADNFALVEGDALELDWDELVRPWTSVGAAWRVVGNIPYYITSPLLDKALTPPLPASVTFLVQEEVAKRLTAEPGTSAYGALTVGVGTVATVEMPMRIGRNAFKPPPRVDSALVHLVPRADPLVSSEQVVPLRKLVVSLFSYRRKRMQRALRLACELDADQAAALLDRAGIDGNLRPESVEPAAFVRLLNLLEIEESED